MKTFSFIIAFLFAGLFLVSFVDYANAGNGLCDFSNSGDCVRCCKDECESDIAEDCSGKTGEDKIECITKNNILVGCCVTDCVEEAANFGSGCLNAEEAPEESVVCEIIDEEICDKCSGLCPD